MPASSISAMAWLLSSKSRAITIHHLLNPITAQQRSGRYLRDVFTMGARRLPRSIRCVLAHPTTPVRPIWSKAWWRGLAATVIALASQRLAARWSFDPGYNGNILVNAFTLGSGPDRPYSEPAPAGAGNPVMYVGSRTGSGWYPWSQPVGLARVRRTFGKNSARRYKSAIPLLKTC